MGFTSRRPPCRDGRSAGEAIIRELRLENITVFHQRNLGVVFMFYLGPGHVSGESHMLTRIAVHPCTHCTTACIIQSTCTVFRARPRALEPEPPSTRATVSRY
eukprot:7788345-Pyramimonas_sp.AAC.2